MRTLTTRNFFDEAFDSFFSPVYKVDKIAMKTDILEKDDHFELAIDLAGFKKEELSINLDKGIWIKFWLIFLCFANYRF